MALRVIVEFTIRSLLTNQEDSRLALIAGEDARAPIIRESQLT